MDFNYNANASYNFNGSVTFVAYIDKDGTIWREGTNGRSIAGYDVKYVSELQERLDEYYNKLVELKVIELPKTPEQIIQEQNQQQAEFNKEMLGIISSLKEEIQEMKNDKELNNNANANNVTELASESSSTDNKKKSSGNK